MSRQETIRTRNWLFEVPAIIAGTLFILIWLLVFDSWKPALILGSLTYLVVVWTLRLTLQKHHLKGMQCIRKEDYAEGAAAFQRSYAFFTKYPWIDRYRCITMFSSSALPYRQMALNNMGFCLLRIGETARAWDAYKLLASLNRDFPTVAAMIEELETLATSTPD